MRRFSKVVLLFLSLLTLFASTTVFASNSDEGNGSGGDSTSGGSMTVVEGVNAKAKTGYLIYTVNGDTMQTASQVLFHTTSSNPVWKTTNSSVVTKAGVETRFGVAPSQWTTTKDICWGYSPWDASSKAGNGANIKSWLLDENSVSQYTCGTEFVLTEYLKYSNEDVLEFQNGNYYLVIEPVMWCGTFENATYTGEVFVGSAKNWASHTSDNFSHVGRYTHEIFPLSCMWEDGKTWLNLPAPTERSGRLDSNTIISNGYGIVAVHSSEIGEGKNLVKVYMTKDKVDKTTYDSVNSPASIKDEEDYKVVEWQTSTEKCEETSTRATWEEVTASSTKTKQGNGVSNVILSEDEKVVYALLVRDTEAPRPTVNNDSIQSYELNYVYKNFSGLREEHNPESFDVADIDMNSAASHKGADSWGIDDTYVVNEGIGGDLWSHKGGEVLLYYTANGLYKNFVSAKEFGINEITQPQYAYNISRALWNDHLVLSNFRGITAMSGGSTAQMFQYYADKYLGIQTGVNGSVTPVSSGVNVDATVADVKNDTYSFHGVAKEHWREKVSDSYTDDDGVFHHAVYEDRESEVSAGTDYSLGHYLDKFKVKDLPTASNSQAGKVVLASQTGNGRATVKQIAALENSQTLSVYPEVKMLMYFMSMTDGKYNNPKEKDAYVLGEYKRTAKPALLSGYRFGITGGKLRGGVSLPSAATGTNADKLMRNFKDSLGGVTAMGTTFEVASTTNPFLDCYTYSLEVQENVGGVGVRDAWNNSAVSIQAEADHDSYVKQLVDSTQVHLMMQCYADATLTSAVSNEFELMCDISKVKITNTETAPINIVYKDGKITNRSDIIQSLKYSFALSEGQAEELLTEWGIEKQLDAMFTSNSDADNGSTGKWYDEESTTLCINVYYNRIIFGQVIGNDKVDYNSLGQDAMKRITNGTKGIEARFYLSFSFQTPVVTVDGKSFNLPEYFCYKEEIGNTRFLIANLTTANMVK